MSIGYLILAVGLLLGAFAAWVLAGILRDRAEDRAAAWEFRHAAPARTFRVALPYQAGGSYRAAPRRTGPLTPSLDLPGADITGADNWPVRAGESSFTALRAAYKRVASSIPTVITPACYFGGDPNLPGLASMSSHDQAGESHVAAPGSGTGSERDRPEARQPTPASPATIKPPLRGDAQGWESSADPDDPVTVATVSHGRRSAVLAGDRSPESGSLSPRLAGKTLAGATAGQATSPPLATPARPGTSPEWVSAYLECDFGELADTILRDIEHCAALAGVNP